MTAPDPVSGAVVTTPPLRLTWQPLPPLCQGHEGHQDHRHHRHASRSKCLVFHNQHRTADRVHERQRPRAHTRKGPRCLHLCHPVAGQVTAGTRVLAGRAQAGQAPRYRAPPAHTEGPQPAVQGAVGGRAGCRESGFWGQRALTAERITTTIQRTRERVPKCSRERCTLRVI